MRKCNLCGKGSKIVGSRRLLRGHYNPVNKSRKYPNLQWARLRRGLGGQARVGGRRVKVCTKCLKSLHKSGKK
ncbi:MAG: bL28 family ribosomal protein [bacterium]